MGLKPKPAAAEKEDRFCHQLGLYHDKIEEGRKRQLCLLEMIGQGIYSDRTSFWDWGRLIDRLK